MADVRGAAGVPIAAAFGGISTPTPSTPLYVNLSTGDLYVLINNVVTLVGAISGGADYIIAEQTFGKHYVVTQDAQDANSVLANRTFGQMNVTPQAILGDASDILMQRSMAQHPIPTMWS